MTVALEGGCGCGAVRYEIVGAVKVVVNCHCNTCRKNNGASFSTYCVVNQSDLRIVEGQESVVIYQVLGGGQKHSCSKCGSPLFNAHARYPGMYMVHYGSLANSANLDPRFNIYCENQLPWVVNLSAITSFQESVG